ncbi:MAG: Gfo/Idh/MocA family oxidoreductase [Verrucomicrobiota bacterium]|jgi:predicted dehydrogenase|nr:Gfo/Idh/MocA family oxidoreductase [Verrucomicrobiota bacterium]MDP7052023.1 Gfo/Idh/MocA family oxidoreductase [Verrucomicrobiota bacterium]
MKSNSLSRRRFLQSTAVASAPFILPSGILSAKLKPNDKISVGFIGMGIQNRGLQRRFMGDKNVVCVAVSDCDTTRRNAARDAANKRYQNKDCTTYVDYREIIARDDIDAVCIATPDHWHAIQTVEAVNSGKDVYCEKPLTHNVHESIEVMNAVKKNKAVLQTGSMQRSSREFRVACELVRNGIIGKVERTAVNIGNAGIPCDLATEKMEPGLDWEKWIGPGPMRGYSSVLSPRGVHGHFPHWRNYKEYGGGMVCDWGAHMIDIVHWGLGMDDSGPVATIPAENPKALKGAQLVYDGNVPLMHGAGMGSSFYGTEGRVECHRGRIGLWLGDKFIAGRTGGDRNVNLGKELDKLESEFLKDAKVKLYRSSSHIPDFLNSMRTRKKPCTHEIIGARTSIACHLLNQTYYNHTAIKWNPKKNTFAAGGDPAWLTRNYRGEYKV